MYIYIYIYTYIHVQYFGIDNDTASFLRAATSVAPGGVFATLLWYRLCWYRFGSFVSRHFATWMHTPEPPLNK